METGQEEDEKENNVVEASFDPNSECNVKDKYEYIEKQDAGIGSISHILKTTFKSNYKINENVSKNDSILKETMEDIQLKNFNMTEVPSLNEEEENNIYTLEEAIKEEDDNSFIKSNLKKVEEIENTLHEYEVQGNALLLYLNECKNKAKKDDEMIINELREKGLVVGVDIPIGPSTLQVDPIKIREFDKYANNIVIASDLMKENLEKILEKSGNGPNGLKQAIQYTTKVDPDYLKTTATVRIRSQIIKENGNN